MSKITYLYEHFERFIAIVLLLLMAGVVLYVTIQFGSALAHSLVMHASTTLFRGDWEQLSPKFDLVRELFGNFLVILIGIELMKTILMYLDDHSVHVEVVLTVAIIAVARHVFDINDRNARTTIGIGVVVLCLTIAYYIFKKAEGTS